MITDKCKICGGRLLSEEIDYEDDLWKDVGIFDYLVINCCGDCGFGFSKPDISSEKVEQFYRSQYRRSGSYFGIDYERMRRPTKLDARAFSQILIALQYCTWNAGDVFLDVGPGSGLSFDVAIKMLEQPNLGGIEFAEGAISAYERLYKVRSFGSILQSAQTFKKAPKIVLSSHSLEHFAFEDAVGFLQELSETMDPKGVFVVEVPHVDLRIHRENRGADAPHFQFFSKDSLNLILAQNGFEVLFIETCGPEYEKGKKIVGDRHSFEAPNRAISRAKEGAKVLIHSVGAKIFKLDKINLNNRNFQYGGDRGWLRLVARPITSRKN